MGKEKKSKNNKINQNNQFLIERNQHAGISSQQFQYVLSELNSVDSTRRENGCLLLANIFQTSKVNFKGSEYYASPEILTALSLRMVDTNILVRLHAAGALRNMCSSHDKTVIDAVLKFGVVHSVNSLFFNTLQSLSSDNVSHIEQYIGTLTSLCSNNEAVIQELIQKQYITKCVEILALTPTPQLPISSLQLLSLQVAVLTSLYVISDDHFSGCMEIFKATANGSLLNTICAGFHVGQHTNLLLMVDSHVKLDENTVDDRLLRLYSFGILSNICLVLSDLNEYQALAYNSILPHLRNISTIPTTLLFLDEKILELSIDDNVESDNTYAAASANPSTAMETTDSLFPLLKVQTTGRPFEKYYDTVKLAAEILANTVAAKENSSDFEDWEDNEENEVKMDTLAQQGGNNVSNQDLQLWIIDPPVIIQTNISSFRRLTQTLQFLVTKLKEMKTPFLATGIDILDTIERIASLLANIFSAIAGTQLQSNPIGGSNEVKEFLSLLFQCFGIASEIFNGVTPTDTHVELWSVSPLINRSDVQFTVSQCMAALANLFVVIHKDTQLSVEGVIAQDQNLRNSRISALLYGVSSVPILETTVSFLETLGTIAHHNGFTIQENKVLSHAVLKRLQEPGARRLRNNKSDGSLLVMEACLSSYIDLHSSDDPSIHQNFLSLNSLEILHSIGNSFKNKLKEEEHHLAREEIVICKETILNLKRFIKYKRK